MIPSKVTCTHHGIEFTVEWRDESCWTTMGSYSFPVSRDRDANVVPAVPSHDGETFWGYTSVPQAAANWWRSLPTSHEESG